MKSEQLGLYGHLRRLYLASALTTGLAMVAGGSASMAQSVDPDAIAGNAEIVSQLSAFDTTVAYVAQFYPLWFTYYQSRLGGNRNRNNLVGSDRISPIFHYVVAINVDTLYVNSYLNLTAQPVIVTIPPTPPFPATSYSILMLDAYGDVLPASIPKTPGSYALIGPEGFTGTLPAEITSIAVPVNFSSLNFRSDKYSPTGEDQIAQADAFRRSLKAQTLSNYLEDPSGGAAKILPEVLFAVPFKTTADNLIANSPIAFLTQLQRAVGSSNTPDFSPYEQALSDRFDSLFANRSANESELSEGTQAAHKLILDRYLTHTQWAAPTPTNWIHFTNIGDWGKQVVERSSITEFIQYANNINAAAYYHVFNDANGLPLDGSNLRSYVLTFAAGQIPQAMRFWSLTAYTPEAIELVPNPANKYAVASYTPPQFNTDGSVSIYMAQELPAGVPMANWLPIPNGAFNIMLRVYGPEGSVADNTYVPPGIQER
jgi:hypothetical protein